MKSKKTIAAVDVSNTVYRDFYGAGGNVAKRTISKARGLIGRLDADVIMAFDCVGPTFRDEIYSEYKAGRDKNPEERSEIRGHIEQVFRHCETSGLRPIRIDGYEADDILASVARKGRLENRKVVIVSSDKDLFSTVQYQGVRLFKAISSIGFDEWGNALVKLVNEVTPELIVERYGVTPAQWTDYRCMTGDSSDNIKGLPGYGPKKAKAVLEIYDSLDELFADWDANKIGFSDKDVARLEEFRARLPIIRQLVDMVDTINVFERTTR